MTVPALLDLAAVKVILGLGPDPGSDDDTYDAAITAALPVVTQWFEQFCDRGLASRVITAEEHHFNPTNRLYVWAYPLTTLTAIKKDGTDSAIDQYRVVAASGYVYGKNGFPRLDDADLIQVSYTGGYAVADVPPDLARAYALAVGSLAGVPSADAALASTSSSSGAIKSIGLGGGALSVSFDTSGAVAAKGGVSGAFDITNFPVEVQLQASVLQAYRRINV
jgi:hypothetical protein